MYSLTIPKEWKLTEKNETSFKKFFNHESFDEDYQLNTNLLLHDRIFIDTLKDSYPGFNQYRNILHIQSLFNFIQPIFDTIHSYKGNPNSIYTPLYSTLLIKNLFIELVVMMVYYIHELRDDSSIVSQDANELFIALDKSDEDLKQEGIDICSRFIMDILNNFILRHYDPTWLFQNKTKENLMKRLSKQKEREKLIHLSNLTNVTKDERFIAGEKQKFGLSNMYKVGIEACEKYVQSDEYRTSTEDERKETLNDLMEEAGIEQIDISHLNLQIELNDDQEENAQAYDFQEDADPDDPEQGMYDEEQEPESNV